MGWRPEPVVDTTGTEIVDPSTVETGTAVRLGILAVNLIIWTGLFLYLLRLSKKVRAVEQAAPEADDEP
jgi:CcmD family protein